MQHLKIQKQFSSFLKRICILNILLFLIQYARISLNQLSYININKFFVYIIVKCRVFNTICSLYFYFIFFDFCKFVFFIYLFLNFCILLFSIFVFSLLSTLLRSFHKLRFIKQSYFENVLSIYWS